jgi:hypothetical protein
VDPDTAESLLRGDRRHATVPDALVHLRAAATAPARIHELAGEETAVAAFRQSIRTPAHPPGRRTLLAGLLAVKIAAALTLTTVGGAALAATSGLTDFPGTSGFGPRPTAPTSIASPAPSATGVITSPSATTPRTPPAPPAASGDPSLEHLCRTFLADAQNKQAESVQRILDSQTFTALIAAAGGRTGVWPYCSRLLGKPAGSAARPTPTASQESEQFRNHNYPSYPGYPQYSGYPQYPGQKQPAQSDQNKSGTETADRDPSPRPGSRSAQPSSLPVGRR